MSNAYNLVYLHLHCIFSHYIMNCGIKIFYQIIHTQYAWCNEQKYWNINMLNNVDNTLILSRPSYLLCYRTVSYENSCQRVYACIPSHSKRFDTLCLYVGRLLWLGIHTLNVYAHLCSSASKELFVKTVLITNSSATEQISRADFIIWKKSLLNLYHHRCWNVSVECIP